MKQKLAILVGIGIAILSSPAFASSFSCERIRADSSAFDSFEAYESWFPARVYHDPSRFVEVGSDSRSLRWKNDLNVGRGYKFYISWQLIPDGRMIVNASGESDFKNIETQYYKCDITPDEIRAARAATKAKAANRAKANLKRITFRSGETYDFLTSFSYQTNKNRQILIGEDHMFIASDSNYMKMVIAATEDGRRLYFAFGRYKNACGDIAQNVNYIEATTRIKTLKKDGIKGILLSDFDLSTSDIYHEKGGNRLAIYLKDIDKSARLCSGNYKLTYAYRKRSYDILKDLYR